MTLSKTIVSSKWPCWKECVWLVCCCSFDLVMSNLSDLTCFILVKRVGVQVVQIHQ